MDGPWWRERIVMVGAGGAEDAGARRGWRAMNATKGYVVAWSFCDATSVYDVEQLALRTPTEPLTAPCFSVTDIAAPYQYVVLLDDAEQARVSKSTPG